MKILKEKRRRMEGLFRSPSFKTFAYLQFAKLNLGVELT